MHKLNPTIALALFVAAIPSLWAVVAPFIGVTVGAATLIVGGFFVASGNDQRTSGVCCLACGLVFRGG